MDFEQDVPVSGMQFICELAEDILSLDTAFLKHPPATFLVNVKADSKLFELHKGDLLLINRSLEPKHGSYVIAVISNKFCIARYQVRRDKAYFYPYNKPVGEDENLEDFLWGVIASVHRVLRA